MGERVHRLGVGERFEGGIVHLVAEQLQVADVGELRGVGEQVREVSALLLTPEAVHDDATHDAHARLELTLKDAAEPPGGCDAFAIGEAVIEGDVEGVDDRAQIVVVPLG